MATIDVEIHQINGSCAHGYLVWYRDREHHLRNVRLNENDVCELLGVRRFARLTQGCYEFTVKSGGVFI